MTAPRAVLPQTTYLLCRRTTRRHFLFRPDADGQMQQVLLYALAVTAKEYGIAVHALTAMSSHLHEVLSDILGLLPAFLQEYRRLQANATKCLRGWPEEVFNKAGNSKVELVSVDAIIDKIAYCIANPVSACAVYKADDWPGLIVLPEDIGVKVFRIKRPEVYYDPECPRWPDEIELPIVMPEVLLKAYGLKGAQRRIRKRVQELEREARAKAKELGYGFGTPASAVQTSFTRRARSFEHFGLLNPTFAASGDREAAIDAANRGRGFRANYAYRRERWQNGDRTTLWPAGTWKMVVVHGAPSEPRPRHPLAERCLGPP